MGSVERGGVLAGGGGGARGVLGQMEHPVPGLPCGTQRSLCGDGTPRQVQAGTTGLGRVWEWEKPRSTKVGGSFGLSIDFIPRSVLANLEGGAWSPAPWSKCVMLSATNTSLGPVCYFW